MENTPAISAGMWNGVMGKLFYVPLLNVLVLLYVYIPGQDLGLAIIALTLLIRLILHPSYIQTLKAQRDMQRIQPYIEKIRQEYKTDQKRQSEEMMKLYQEHKVSPLGSCLPLIIQMPILFALYRVCVAGLSTESLAHLYKWFPNAPQELHTSFLAFTNIAGLTVDLNSRSIYLAVLAGVAQLVQSIVATRNTPSTGGNQAQAMTQRVMLYTLPALTVVLALSLPSALSLYWVTSTAIMAIEQIIFYRAANRQEQALIATTHHGDDN